jgi:hypothetical protein
VIVGNFHLGLLAGIGCALGGLFLYERWAWRQVPGWSS